VRLHSIAQLNLLRPTESINVLKLRLRRASQLKICSLVLVKISSSRPYSSKKQKMQHAMTWVLALALSKEGIRWWDSAKQEVVRKKMVMDAVADCVFIR
jgi:hypothetical protein